MKYLLATLLPLLTLSLFAQSIQDGTSTYAVVVGISDYQDGGIPDLRFADRDAEAFANFLRSPAGGNLDEDHLELLTNQQATLGQFAAALDWLLEVVHEGDRAIIYFSGHGDVESKRLSQPGYLLGWDAPARNYMAGGAVNVRDFQDILSTLSVSNKAKVLLITDACHAGKLSGSEINGAQLTSQNLARQFANEIKILSCQANEYSIEGEQWGGGRGAFSYFLVDGLYGIADSDVDGSVNLLEIGRYLQDKVSTEVAPLSQIPLTVGNFSEKLVDVFPDILAQIKAGKKAQLQMFSATESKGIEEEVLTAADSSIVKMYYAFKQAIKEKRFLPSTIPTEKENNYADYYYTKLIGEPQLDRLQSSMRRNYAAALQDDAQQFLNLMLRGGFTQKTLKRSTDSYKYLPDYLERASELLGKGHYMYPVLQARKYFMDAYLTKDKQQRKKGMFKALELQPNMPHAYCFLIGVYDAIPDSALYFFNKTTELLPQWNYPYIFLGNHYARTGKFDKAEATFLQGLALDTSSTHMKYWLANFYMAQFEYDKAKPYLIDIIASLSPEICFTCAQEWLASIYGRDGQFDKAIPLAKNLIESDTTSLIHYHQLAWFYSMTKHYVEAEQTLLKAISIDNQIAMLNADLGLLYINMDRYEEADKQLALSLDLDFDQKYAYVYYAVLYSKQKQLDKAFEYLELALKAGYNNPRDAVDINTYPDLAFLREQTSRWNELMKKYFPEKF